MLKLDKKHDFSSNDLSMKIELDQNITNAKFYYLTTGPWSSQWREMNLISEIIF